MSKEAMKLALEALSPWAGEDANHTEQYAAYQALREALAEQPAQQQEPVAWMYPDDYERMTTSETFCTVYSVEVGSATRGKSTVALYTSAPAQRKPLTDEELYAVFPAIATYHEANKTLYRSIARAIEAAHGIKEKNT